MGGLYFRPQSGGGICARRPSTVGEQQSHQIGTASEPYYTAWDELRPALEKARYPLTRISFSSTYGTGHVVSLWLSRGRAELAAAPSISDAITSVLGKEKATAILEQHRSGVVSTERHEILRRRDLDSPEPAAAH